jgi:MFS superfamily sulfate permease-like transporter
MNAGVTSITALMAKSDLNGEAYAQEFGEEAYVELVAAYSLYCGIASIFLAVVGFGALASKVPKSVRSGFKYGCSVGVLVSALPAGLFNGGSSELKKLVAGSAMWNDVNVWFKTNAAAATGAINVSVNAYALTHPWEWAIAPTVIFVAATWFFMSGKKMLPSSLPPGTEVILATAAATLYSMHFEYSGDIVGEIPQVDSSKGINIAGISLPIEVLDYQAVLDAPVADRMGGWPMLAIATLLFSIVNFVSIMGICSGFETENGIAWSPAREMTSQGVSCLVAAAVGSAPVSGSMSRSLVSRMTGTTSQLACILTACIWILALPYMSIMTPTPKAVLSSVIVSAVVQSVCIPKDLMNLKGVDFVVGWSTGILTAVTSPTIGFALGLVIFGITYPLRSSDVDKKKKQA